MTLEFVMDGDGTLAAELSAEDFGNAPLPVEGDLIAVYSSLNQHETFKIVRRTYFHDPGGKLNKLQFRCVAPNAPRPQRKAVRG